MIRDGLISLLRPFRVFVLPLFLLVIGASTCLAQQPCNALSGYDLRIDQQQFNSSVAVPTYWVDVQFTKRATQPCLDPQQQCNLRTLTCENMTLSEFWQSYLPSVAPMPTTIFGNCSDPCKEWNPDLQSCLSLEGSLPLYLRSSADTRYYNIYCGGTTCLHNDFSQQSECMFRRKGAVCSSHLLSTCDPSTSIEGVTCLQGKCQSQRLKTSGPYHKTMAGLDTEYRKCSSPYGSCSRSNDSCLLSGSCVSTALVQLGGNCTKSSDCSSWFCSLDGYCCTTPCNSGPCQSCATGTCAYTETPTTPCNNDNGLSPEPHSRWGCSLASATCVSQCVNDLQCERGFACSSNPPCSRLRRGSKCQSNAQCASGFCSTDNRCTNEPCSLPCQKSDPLWIYVPWLNETQNPLTCIVLNATHLCNDNQARCNGHTGDCPLSCQTKEDCATGFFCSSATGTCTPTIGRNEICEEKTACTTGLCSADGRCCLQQCEECGDCLSSDGTVCQPKSQGTPCSDQYTCDGVHTQCIQSCIDDYHCTEESYCARGSHQCVRKRDHGHNCTYNVHCMSGICSSLTHTCALNHSTISVSDSEARTLSVYPATRTVERQNPNLIAFPSVFFQNRPRVALGSTGCDLLLQNCVDPAICIPTKQNQTTICCDSTCDRPCEDCHTVAGRCLPSLPTPSSTACAPFLCTGRDATCPTYCNTSVDCDGFCDSQHRCQPPRPTTSPCNTSHQCNSRICSQGICCSVPCTKPCSRCSPQTGVCEDVACSPMPYRLPNAESCRDDQDCSRGFVCHQATGRCLPPSPPGSSCSHPSHCSSGNCDPMSRICCAHHTTCTHTHTNPNPNSNSNPNPNPNPNSNPNQTQPHYDNDTLTVCTGLVSICNHTECVTVDMAGQCMPMPTCSSHRQCPHGSCNMTTHRCSLAEVKFCELDKDCNSTSRPHRCFQNICTPLATAGLSCDTDQDCLTGLYCSMGTCCTEPCTDRCRKKCNEHGSCETVDQTSHDIGTSTSMSTSGGMSSSRQQREVWIDETGLVCNRSLENGGCTTNEHCASWATCDLPTNQCVPHPLGSLCEPHAKPTRTMCDPSVSICSSDGFCCSSHCGPCGSCSSGHCQVLSSNHSLLNRCPNRMQCDGVHSECPDSGLVQGPCVSPFTWQYGRCQLQPPGHSCTNDSQCTTNICSHGVCCKQICPTGDWWSCSNGDNCSFIGVSLPEPLALRITIDLALYAFVPVFLDPPPLPPQPEPITFCSSVRRPNTTYTPLSQKQAGETCGFSEECVSGVCTESGVCCDRLCDGPCESCLFGVCLLTGASPISVCAPYICRDSPLCPNHCIDSDDCVHGAVCDLENRRCIVSSSSSPITPQRNCSSSHLCMLLYPDTPFCSHSGHCCMEECGPCGDCLYGRCTSVSNPNCLNQTDNVPSPSEYSPSLITTTLKQYTVVLFSGGVSSHPCNKSGPCWYPNVTDCLEMLYSEECAGLGFRCAMDGTGACKTRCDDHTDCDRSSLCDPITQLCFTTRPAGWACMHDWQCSSRICSPTSHTCCLHPCEGHCAMCEPGTGQCQPKAQHSFPFARSPDTGLCDGIRLDHPTSCVHATCSSSSSCDPESGLCVGLSAMNCTAGYEGRDCASDVDECLINNGGCDPNTICVNRWSGRDCGPCPQGMSGRGGEWGCVAQSACPTMCHEREICLETLEGTAVCTHSSSTCDIGFSWSTTEKKCRDIDECIARPCGNGTCENLQHPGTYKCNCWEGYMWSVDNGCVDIDECSSPLMNSCSRHPPVSCTNTLGSYVCGDCPGPGWISHRSNSSCLDIDECTSPNACPHRRQCINTMGSFLCGPCPSGYVLDDDTCIDVDECKTSTHNCNSRSNCINTVGNFTCSDCALGLAGPFCSDVDECAVTPGPCSPWSSCRNTFGSFLCGPCPSGFVGDGVTCHDINECSSRACGLYRQCANAPGTFVCGPCPFGLQSPSSSGSVTASMYNDTSECEDIDECALGHCDVSLTCINLFGGYACTGFCPPGSSRIGNQCSSEQNPLRTQTPTTQSAVCDLYRDDCDRTSQRCQPISSSTLSVSSDQWTCTPCPSPSWLGGDRRCKLRERALSSVATVIVVEIVTGNGNGNGSDATRNRTLTDGGTESETRSGSGSETVVVVLSSLLSITVLVSVGGAGVLLYRKKIVGAAGNALEKSDYENRDPAGGVAAVPWWHWFTNTNVNPYLRDPHLLP